MEIIRRRNKNNRRPAKGLLTRKAHSLLMTKAPSAASITSTSTSNLGAGAKTIAKDYDADDMDDSDMMHMDDSALDFYDTGLSGRRGMGQDGDLETGCPTKEGDDRVPLKTHKKNDDLDDAASMDPRQRFYHQVYQKAFVVLTTVYHKTSFVLDNYVFEGLPLCLRIALVLHALTCLYGLSVIWSYYDNICGSMCAFFITTLVGASFLVTSLTAMVGPEIDSYALS